MPVDHVEILVEEPSAEAALRLLVPKILASRSFEVHAHNGKADLLRKLQARLAGYRGRRGNDQWFRERCRLAVLVDRDQQNCLQLKRQLETAATNAGLATRSQRPNGDYFVVTRIAIEELEAWFFGDWEAVRAAYPKVPATIRNRARYRHSDSIGDTWEALERILVRAGYFRGGLRKIEAARGIAGQMEPARNDSPSFRAFHDALMDMTAP